MEVVDLIIHAKWIVTCNEHNTVLEDAALIVQNGNIAAILPSKEVSARYQSQNEQHFSRHALMPGFVNAHTHSAMNIFRGLADDLELMDWLNNHIWPRESEYLSKELVQDAGQLAVAEMIRSGTTTFNDMYFYLPEMAQVVDKAGLRAHLGITIIGIPTNWAKTSDEYIDKGLAFYHEYKNHPRITTTFAPHSTYTVELDDLIRVKELADEYRLKINIHLQEAPSEIEQITKKYGQRPLQRLEDIGMVSPNLIAVHMTQIDENDFHILSHRKPNIVHCPESNMKLVSGQCPVAKLQDMGINVALGTDGAASNNDLDMIAEMRSAAFLGKITAQDPKAVNVREVIKMATINGAKALGTESQIGSLEPNKAADMIAIDLGQIETQPLYHPISQIVFAASRHQVTDVWVAGKQLLKNRELLTLDEDAILQKAQYWQAKLRED